MIKPLSRMGTWKTYSVDDGLPSLRIEHIAEGPEGYIWFATWDNGASRFDGDEFQNFTTQDGLVHDRVSFIQKDRQERLWFGTLKGVCWYDGADFHPLEDDGIAGRSVQFIYEDRQGRNMVRRHRYLGILRRHGFPRLNSHAISSSTSRLLLLSGTTIVGASLKIRKVTCGLALITSPASMANPSTATKKMRVFPKPRPVMP